MKTISKEQIELMIESLEELSEELSDNSHGNLVTEQWNLLDHLRLVRDNFVLDIVIETPSVRIIEHYSGDFVIKENVKSVEIKTGDQLEIIIKRDLSKY